MHTSNLKTIVNFCYKYNAVRDNLPLAHDIADQVFVAMLDSRKYKKHAKREVILQAVLLLRDRTSYLAVIMNASGEHRFNLDGTENHIKVTSTEAGEALLRFNNKINSTSFIWECA
jgi:hypothetical protein